MATVTLGEGGRREAGKALREELKEGEGNGGRHSEEMRRGGGLRKEDGKAYRIIFFLFFFSPTLPHHHHQHPPSTLWCQLTWRRRLPRLQPLRFMCIERGKSGSDVILCSDQVHKFIRQCGRITYAGKCSADAGQKLLPLISLICVWALFFFLFFYCHSGQIKSDFAERQRKSDCGIFRTEVLKPGRVDPAYRAHIGLPYRSAINILPVLNMMGLKDLLKVI